MIELDTPTIIKWLFDIKNSELEEYRIYDGSFEFDWINDIDLTDDLEIHDFIIKLRDLGFVEEKFLFGSERSYAYVYNITPKGNLLLGLDDSRKQEQMLAQAIYDNALDAFEHIKEIFDKADAERNRASYRLGMANLTCIHLEGGGRE